MARSWRNSRRMNEASSYKTNSATRDERICATEVLAVVGGIDGGWYVDGGGGVVSIEESSTQTNKQPTAEAREQQEVDQ